MPVSRQVASCHCIALAQYGGQHSVLTCMAPAGWRCGSKGMSQRAFPSGW